MSVWIDSLTTGQYFAYVLILAFVLAAAISTLGRRFEK